MSKSKKSRKSYEEEQAMDGDDVYDEIDHFHMERDSILLAGTKRRPKSRTKEILSVRVDESEDDQIYGEEATSQMNNDAEETAPVNVNQWGKKRANYYGTSYVDKDFGGVNDSDEEEMLELEEEDAIARQRKLDVANNYVDLDFALRNDDTAKDDSDEISAGEEDNIQANQNVSGAKVTTKYGKKASREQKLKYFLDQNKEISEWLLEYEEKKEEFEQAVKRLSNVLHAIKSIDSKLTRQLSTIMEKVDLFLNENGRSLTKLIDRFDRDPDEFVITLKKQLEMNGNTTEKSKKQTSVRFATDNDIDTNEGYDDTEWDQNDEEKRGISYEMQKNKGLTQKRKRGTQHSRLKKRKQYDKALIRRRSQVPDVRREERKYDGEKRGIRASTVRSIKLK
ncbi:something about silencing protein 10 [Ditylenchus destructor]|nr:something about silencing protein 10 [Ditylenchus destructor]